MTKAESKRPIEQSLYRKCSLHTATLDSRLVHPVTGEHIVRFLTRLSAEEDARIGGSVLFRQNNGAPRLVSRWRQKTSKKQADAEKGRMKMRDEDTEKSDRTCSVMRTIGSSTKIDIWYLYGVFRGFKRYIGDFIIKECGRNSGRCAKLYREVANIFIKYTSQVSFKTCTLPVARQSRKLNNENGNFKNCDRVQMQMTKEKCHAKGSMEIYANLSVHRRWA